MLLLLLPPLLYSFCHLALLLLLPVVVISAVETTPILLAEGRKGWAEAAGVRGVAAEKKEEGELPCLFMSASLNPIVLPLALLLACDEGTAFVVFVVVLEWTAFSAELSPVTVVAELDLREDDEVEGSLKEDDGDDDGILKLKGLTSLLCTCALAAVMSPSCPSAPPPVVDDDGAWK